MSESGGREGKSIVMLWSSTVAVSICRVGKKVRSRASELTSVAVA